MDSDIHTFVALGIAVTAVVASLTLAPWLMGRWYRKQGESPRYFWRALACFLMGTAASQLLIILALSCSNGVIALFSAVGLVILWGVCWTKLHLSKLPTFSWLTLVIILCNCLYFEASGVESMRGYHRAREFYSENNLRLIEKALIGYTKEHGRPPDDLRQLVGSEGFTAKCLLSPLSNSRQAHFGPILDTVPYIGPCEYECNHLPLDVPAGLAWVWEDPQYLDLDWECPAVLYTGGRVQRIRPKWVQEDLARTQEWMKSHPYPTMAASASCPATSAAKEP